MASWWRSVMDTVAFKLGYVASDAIHEAEYESMEARQSRYVIYWAWYQNQAYSRANIWATGYKHQYALSKYIRNLYNPAYRLGEFYSSHLFGGALDREAGEGGAIPIQTENEALRPAIAELWQRSNMATLKDVMTLRGTIEGDVFLQVVDDVKKQRVYLSRIDPGLITECDFDPRNNIKAYVREETRPRPNASSGTVQYRLDVSRSGDNVVYETFLNGKPYAWDGQPAQWKAPYTFVPLVLIQHRNVGLDWGHSELHSIRSKVHEVDNIASMIGDHIGRHMNPPFLASGIEEGALKLSGATKDETGNVNTRPQPGKEEIRILYGADPELDASLEAVIASLDVEQSLAHTAMLLEELERDCPELQQDIWASGATSGRALRVARQRVEAKVLQRREGYDSGLVRAQQMAVAIGGMRGYQDYEGFNIESYERGDLDHSIAPRPVFAPDVMDNAEVMQAEWIAIKTATDAGASLESAMRSMDWTDERIAEIVSTQEEPGGDQDDL